MACTRPQFYHDPLGEVGGRMRIILVAALAATVAGCATVTRGTTAQLQIISNPPEATARTWMGYQCLTPCTVQVNRATNSR